MGEPRMFLDGRVALHAGDCLDVLRLLPENSIDAINTDPPYALTSITERFGSDGAAPAQFGTDGAFARASRGFMGRTWDTGERAFSAEFWRECLRVLKPGGHLVAFSGTRTYHRMAVAIEDAGFDIRDQLAWAYGVGFPKALNVQKSGKERVCGCGPKGAGPQGQCQLRPVQCDDVSAPFDLAEECREVLFASMSECRAPDDRGIPSGDVRVEQSCMEGRRDSAQEAGQLSVRSVREVSVSPIGDGAKGRVRDGAPSRDGGQNRKAAKPDRMCASHRPQSSEQRDEQFGAVPGQPEPQAGGVWENCRRCGKPIVDGWATALKPAWEPIALARKPLDGTVVETMLRHGTGALNVGGCRIGTDSVSTQIRALDAIHGGALGDPAVAAARRGLETTISDPRVGRYPANIVHDGSAEVAACFPTVDDVSAARFFYSAKADGDDRHGLNHPTIKPVDLMRWLARLTCRKGGTILDPFAGTGTTAEAAYWEGCNAVLVEREEEYQAAIAIRMGLVLAGPDERKRARTKLVAAEGLPLFGSGNDKTQSDAA